MSPKTVHLVFKTHLDIGFTDHAEAVRRRYHERFIPDALSTAEHFHREDAGAPAFVWTTGAWLIHDHLETQRPAQVARLENAIEKGLIRWHALPFTTHSELMSPALFRAGLSYSQTLDHRFGLTTRAAKMTDVPGHTIALVPLLAAAGVRFLHLGVNTACPVPDVPPVFRWRAPDGSEIIVMYQNSYGETCLPHGMEDAIAFAHTEDNIGPQSVAQTVVVWREMTRRFPDADIRAATLEDYGALLWAHRDALPAVDLEIGDSWLHGAASDPAKLARFRALQRLYDDFETEGLTDARLTFGQRLCLVAEHTWGVDIKTYLRDEMAWDRATFDDARARDYRFSFCEASWAEQRGYLDDAVAALPPEDRARAEAAEPPPAIPALQTAPGDPASLDVGGWRVETDPGTGDVTALIAPGGKRIDGRDGGPLLSYRHMSFDASDMRRHLDTYLIDRPDWAVLDHDKPGLDQALTARSARLAPSFTGLCGEGDEIEIAAEMPDEARRALGAPARLRWRVGAAGQRLRITLVLEDKPANRMPEAGFITLSPQGASGWQLLKSGLWIDPSHVARRGGGALQSIFAARTAIGNQRLSLVPLDAGLAAPEGMDLMTFALKPPRWRNGLSMLLYTNKWGTNFPMWWEGDLVSRLDLALTPST